MSRLLNLVLSSLSRIIMFDCNSPAILKVLLADMAVTRRGYSGIILPIGICLFPRLSRSQCISSEITHRLFFSAISAMRLSSASVHMRPVGLWGLHSSSMAADGSPALLSRSSKSISNLPLFFLSGEAASSTPLYSQACRK